MPTCGECPIAKELCPKISEIRVIQRDDPECEPRKRWRESMQYADSLNDLCKSLSEEKLALSEQVVAAHKEIDDLLSVLRGNVTAITKKDILELLSVNWTLAKAVFKEITWNEDDVKRYKDRLDVLLSQFI